MYIDNRYRRIVIRSIRGQLTQDLFDGKNSKEARKLDQALHAVARRKLDQLNAASKLEDLRIPPGNRLEVLSGDLKGLHIIRINDYRYLFYFGYLKSISGESCFAGHHQVLKVCGL